MTIPLSSGSSSNLPPDYSSESDKVQVKRSLSEGSSASKGAILAKDSLEVPFEKQVSIHANEAEAGRPFLPPLFRTRFVDDREVEDLSRDHYLALRNDLSPRLKEKLANDEALLESDRDPDLIALDNSLKFEAHLLALSDRLSIPISSEEKILLGAKNYMALPDLVQNELLSYGTHITHFLDGYLSKIGPNDSSYDLFRNVSNQMKETLELLSYRDQQENQPKG